MIVKLSVVPYNSEQSTMAGQQRGSPTLTRVIPSAPQSEKGFAKEMREDRASQAEEIARA